MRCLKFRLRDKNNEILGYEIWSDEYNFWQYCFLKNTNFSHCPICHSSIQGLELFNRIRNKDQFTGLKDKNGKEIYEGDIVKGVAHNYKIRYVNDRFRLEDRATGILDLFERAFKIEVIGNIYENKELLNG